MTKSKQTSKNEGVPRVLRDKRSTDLVLKDPREAVTMPVSLGVCRYCSTINHLWNERSFGRHSVHQTDSELSILSDYELHKKGRVVGNQPITGF